MKNLLSRFYNQSISRKLAAIVLLTSGLLISVMTVAVSIEKKLSFKDKLVNSSNVLAEVIGANTAAALLYNDEETAHEMLTALKAEQDVIAAAVYTKDGKMFASYRNSSHHGERNELQPPQNITGKDGSTLSSYDHFNIVQDIILQGDRIGYIILLTDLTRLNKQVNFFWVIITSFSILLFIIAMLLCFRLNRSIADPVHEIVKTMQNVISTNNYTARVAKIHNDEIGILADGFNAMLAQIDKRDGELEKHRHQLEDLVATRTRELQLANDQLLKEIKERMVAQNKLVHAEKMEAIGTLAGGVAHDLNNILSGIVTYPDLLLLDLHQDSHLRPPLETIRSSGKKAAAIVEDLLTLSRRGVRIQEKFDLQNLVIEYLKSPELKEILSRYSGVTIDFEQKDEQFQMIGSPLHLSKTIMNLVTNGIEAMEKGGSLSISLDNLLLDSQPSSFEQWRRGRYILLKISDTGIGIHQKDISRIFEPFYSKKSMGKSGTGLGMAVVWGTVEDHRGYITLESEPDTGTTFQLFFPAEKSEQELESDNQMIENLYHGNGQSVLVVDDSEEQRQIASEILTHLGYSVTTVESGEAALKYLEEKSVDLVILDMLMAPGINGLETFKRLLAMRPEQKALIASGYSHPSHIDEARDLGVISYVMKPYSVSHIGKVVFNALHQKSD